MVQRRAHHPSPTAATRPFATAMWTLAVSCLLLSVAAFLHEDSPVTRLMAELAAAQPKTPLGPPQPVSRPRQLMATIVTLPNATTHTPALGVAHLLTASQGSRGATIQLGPLTDTKELPSAKDFKHKIGTEPTIKSAAAEPAPLVTRTYHPVSMSAVSLERLVRPLLTPRGETVAVNADAPAAKTPAVEPKRSLNKIEVETADRPGFLVVSDRPDAIGRVDALCHDLESTTPRIAVDLIVVDVLPNAGRQLPWEQWRNNFGTLDSDLPTALKQIRDVGHSTLQVRSQLQATSGTWTELESSAQSIVPGNSGREPGNAAPSEGSDSSPSSSSTQAPAALTTLRIRPTTQPDGRIRIEVRAQSSRLDDRARGEQRQLMTVRFQTEVVLREGATGVINLFVDEPLPSSSPSVASTSAGGDLAMPGGPLIPATQIVPQPGQREQTLLLLMPRIAGTPPRPAGKIAASKAPDPA